MRAAALALTMALLGLATEDVPLLAHIGSLGSTQAAQVHQLSLDADGHLHIDAEQQSAPAADGELSEADSSVYDCWPSKAHQASHAT